MSDDPEAEEHAEEATASFLKRHGRSTSMKCTDLMLPVEKSDTAKSDSFNKKGNSFKKMGAAAESFGGA